jgi:hypothetical protein
MATTATRGAVRVGSPRPTAASTVAARWAAAAAALIAAGIHLDIAPEHLREWWLYGGFFLTVAAAQAALAVLVLRAPRLIVLLGGIWGTVGLIGIYVLSRTTGLPISPPGGHAGHALGHGHAVVAGVLSGVPIIPGSGNPNVERVGSLDLTALGAELILIVALVALLSPAARRWTTNLMVVLAVGAWATGALVSFG